MAGRRKKRLLFTLLDHRLRAYLDFAPTTDFAPVISEAPARRTPATRGCRPSSER